MAEEINFQLKSPEEINFGRKLTLLKKKSREEINFNFLLKGGGELTATPRYTRGEVRERAFTYEHGY